MDESIIKIADLLDMTDSELENASIKASVSIKSIRHGNSRHGYFYMDVRDDSGDITAAAYIDNESYGNQLCIIEENKTYKMTALTLANSNKFYTSISNEIELVLSDRSSVELCGHAPKVGWPLTPLNDVYSINTPIFFNIVGICTKVAETRIVNGELTRQVILIDELRTEVILNVWNQETALFDELDLKFHPVLFVKDAKLYKPRGSKSLTSSRYLSLLDPSDPRAVRIRKAIHQVNNHFHANPIADRTLAKIESNYPDKYPYCTTANFTKKQRVYVKIAHISESTPNLEKVTVVATVTMKSYKMQDEVKTYFVMDLRDESGEILAITDGEAWLKFYHAMEKNRTYSITGFSVISSSKNLTSIPHDKVLILNDGSEVKLCGIAPKINWPMSPLTVVYGHNKKEFFHAFGLCTKISETDEGKKLRLVDQLSRELTLEVDDDANMDAILEALDLKTHPVFFVKDAQMAVTNKCDPILNLSLYLELLEPDDPRARRVTKALLPSK